MSSAAAKHDPLGRESRIRKLSELALPPPDAQRLLDIVAHDDLDIADLARQIELSPVLAARIVGIAGSAYFARPVPVRSVQDAVIGVLGLDLVRGLVMGIVAANALRPPPRSAFDATRYWTSALVTAGFARSLARYLLRKRAQELHRWSESAGEDPLHPDAAYLCGLLHNLGLLALMVVEPEGMEQVFRLARERPDWPLRLIEHELLGTDHGVVGSQLVKRWKLPQEVGVVSATMHDSEYDGVSWCLSAVVGQGAREARRYLHSGLEPPPGGSEFEPTARFGLEQRELKSLRAEFADALGDIQGMARLFAEAG